MFLNHLYGGMDEPELKIIDVFICKLRKKLANAAEGKNFIETVWGRGYALEAARACVAAAFTHLPQRRLVAKVEPENARSLRLAERLGMRTVETIAVDGRPHLLLALERA